MAGGTGDFGTDETLHGDPVPGPTRAPEPAPEPDSGPAGRSLALLWRWSAARTSGAAAWASGAAARTSSAAARTSSAAAMASGAAAMASGARGFWGRSEDLVVGALSVTLDTWGHFGYHSRPRQQTIYLANRPLMVKMLAATAP